MPVIDAIIERLTEGKTLEQTQAFALANRAADDPQDLFDTAARATQLFASHVFNICGVVSAKTGACSCDCKWCPQSSHWPVKGIPIHPILPTQEIEEIAQRAMDAGIRKFALVASCGFLPFRSTFSIPKKAPRWATRPNFRKKTS